MCGAATALNCVFTYKITVTGGPNPGLITLPNPASPTVAFARSTNLLDIGIYVIAV